MSQTLKKALLTYQQGDFPAALTLTKRVITAERLRSQDIFALLGNTLVKLGKPLEAGDAFVEAGKFATPKSPLMAKFAINLFQTAGARDRILAAGAQAMALNPGDSNVAFAYGAALFGDGQFGAVPALFDALDRGNVKHMALIINTHRVNGNFDYLSRELEAACNADPSDVFLQVSRFVVAREICDLPALDAFERIMADPETPQAAAVLAGEPALNRIFWNEDEALNRCPSTDSIRAARVPAATYRRPFSAEGQKIRIGYLSCDFYDHATMRLFAQVMGIYDPARFEVTLFCYSDSQHAAWQQVHFPPRIAAAIVPVRDLTDADAAALIATHGIDILVDLKGLTMNSRLGIVNLSDAPVKVTYLGFPSSAVGADLDYVISDAVVTPDSSKPFFHEKLCRLPESYQANDSVSRPLPLPSTRAAWGLPEEGFIFASFNASQKINRRTVTLWSRILAGVPGSIAWILCDKLIGRTNLLAAFAAENIGPERIVFTGSAGYAAHLARLPVADLGLDTFPCNGHTTTSDMLWAGLPVLTARGTNFASRVTESLLLAMDLPELVTADDAAFCAAAIALAGDPPKIAALKTRIETNRFQKPLFDAERTATHLQAAYSLMAARARTGLPPDHIDVPAQPPRTAPFASRIRGG